VFSHFFYLVLVVTHKTHTNSSSSLFISLLFFIFHRRHLAAVEKRQNQKINVFDMEGVEMEVKTE